jgi:hypothetical protein
MLPDQAWALENHLAVAGAGGQPLYTLVSGKKVWYIKGAAGYPWDMNSFDESYIYRSITGNVLTSPTTFKMFASGTWPYANGGIVWAPRYFTPGAFTPPIVTADSTYRAYSACATFTTQTLGGPVETQISGPYEIAFGISPGVQESIIQTYKWGPGYATMEVNCYAKGLGLVQWQSYTLVNGVYVLKQSSLFGTQVAGGVVPLNFPCGVPTI